MHWSLDQVRDMDAAEYDALIEWANTRAEKRSAGDEGSVDMDVVLDGKVKKPDA